MSHVGVFGVSWEAYGHAACMVVEKPSDKPRALRLVLGCFQKEEAPRTKSLVPSLLVLGASTAEYVKVHIGDLKKVIGKKHPREKQYRRKK